MTLAPKYVRQTKHNIEEIDVDNELQHLYEAGITENRVTFRLGNISKYATGAIVCPWVTENANDGFYSKNIYNAGGPGLHAELERIWPSRLPATNSILTGSHDIKTCKHIIHVREPTPPILSDEEEEDVDNYWSPYKVQGLKDCITACLIMAISLDCETIAIPPLGIRRMRNRDRSMAPTPPGETHEQHPGAADETSADMDDDGKTGPPRWHAEVAAKAVLQAVGEFRTTSPFRDRLQEIVFLFHDLDDLGGDELAAFRHSRLWSIHWSDPYKVPRLLPSRKKRERDQRLDELSGPNSVQSLGSEPDSGRESRHSSDEEPTKPNFPAEIPLSILENVYYSFPVPLGVYLQFDSLFIPSELHLLDLYQPAVYGYIRYVPPILGKRYEGWDVDISRTSRKGRWVLGARISNHTIDGRLIGRPLDHDEIISLDDPRLRLCPEYRLILNPENVETRQVMVERYLRNIQRLEYHELHQRWTKRREIGLRAQNYRRELRRRYRRLVRRRQKRFSVREQIKWSAVDAGEEPNLTPSPSPSSSINLRLAACQEATPGKGYVRVKGGSFQTPILKTESPASTSSSDEAGGRIGGNGYAPKLAEEDSYGISTDDMPDFDDEDEYTV